jgi:hypothetical protein
MAYMGFQKLESSIAARGGVRNPAAVAASIGRKKYGKSAFQKAASRGESMRGATPKSRALRSRAHAAQGNMREGGGGPMMGSGL